MIYDVAIIGDGFSGLMVAAQAVRKGLKPYWAGRSARPGRGTAHGTTEECHLLNVQADRMGAWDDRPQDFWVWLNTNHPGQFQPDDYVPRRLFGDYLESIRAACHLTTDLTPVTGAERRDKGWRLTRADGEFVECAQLVLAQGNPPPGDPGWPRNDLYIPDFWDWRLKGGRVEPGDGVIVMVGAGLTMADAALSVREDGHKGGILALSPHGRLPAVHESGDRQDDTLARRIKKYYTSIDYFEVFRSYMNKNRHVAWRDEVNGLRSQTTALWQALPEEEKARFMRHLWSLWNVHRHRMAPAIARKLENRVTVAAGRMTGTAEDGTVTFRPRGSSAVQTVTARKVINCMGPGYRHMLANDPLLADLLRQGHIAPGPLGLGIRTPRAPGLHAIGTLLLGERLETTAIPELRAQAAEIGKML